MYRTLKKFLKRGGADVSAREQPQATLTVAPPALSDDVAIRRLLENLLFISRDQWKHLAGAAFHEQPRVELGAVLSDMLQRTVARLSDGQLAETYRNPQTLRPLLVEHQAGAVEQVEQLIVLIQDPILADLWQRGGWSALENLLALNLLHFWSPKYELWHAPGFNERGAAARSRADSLPQPHQEELSDEDWALIVRTSRAFQHLTPFSSESYSQPVKMFVCAGMTLGYDPLHMNADADRLAERLRIFVRTSETGAHASIGNLPDMAWEEPLENHGGNFKAAARRAITEVAARYLDAGLTPSPPLRSC